MVGVLFSRVALGAIVLAVCGLPLGRADEKSAGRLTQDSLVVVVSDPLSARLACDCVSGYAQRDYEKLGSYLEQKLQRPVTLVFAESLPVALKEHTNGRADLVIGKDSVVRYQAERLKLPPLRPIASLTNLEGKTTLTGLFVVRGDSSVTSVLDLEGYQILFGTEACDEKWAMPKATLQELEISINDSSKSCDTCSIAAKQLVALPSSAKAAAVISSYAVPLLEGCGTIEKGALRSVGHTAEVRFISCFVSSQLPEEQQRLITQALLEIKSPELLTALETKSGFVAYQ